MNTSLLESKPFIGSNNLIIYFQNIYNIWHIGFTNIVLEQFYQIMTCMSICILFSKLIPFMMIPCIIFFIIHFLYILRYISSLWKSAKLDIYCDSWEETCFNLVELQHEYQICRIKPLLTQNDIKEYILFSDKYLSHMVQNKTIPFPTQPRLNVFPF